jgi:enoyl-CoA hydratase
VQAGWLDRVVEPDAVIDTARAVAVTAAGLDARAHVGSKLRGRAHVLDAMRRAIDVDRAELGL